MTTRWHPTQLFSSLWRNRLLVGQFTRRFVQMRHKGSYLGAVWTLLNPLLLMGLYSFVFGVIFNGRYGAVANETAIDYAFGVFLSLTLFQMIAEVLGVSITLIVGNANLVKKVPIPLETLPVAAVGAALNNFFFSLGLVIVAVLLVHGLPGPEALFLPFLILPVFFFCLGIAWFFSALGVYIRDLGQLIQFLSLTLMYSSGIFYSKGAITGAGIPELLKDFVLLNPLIHLVEQARGVLLWGLPPDLWAYLYALFVSLVTMYAGHAFFMKLKRGFADVL